MTKLADVQINPQEKYGNLDLEKLVGKKIVRVEGYPSSEFGRDAMVFKLFAIEFEDGSKLFVEGEHDCGYLPADGMSLQQDTLLALYKELNGDSE